MKTGSLVAKSPIEPLIISETNKYTQNLKLSVTMLGGNSRITKIEKRENLKIEITKIDRKLKQDKRLENLQQKIEK